MMNRRNVLKTLAMVSLLAPMPQLQAAASNEASGRPARVPADKAWL
jgi:hypothetical protein